MKTIRIAGVPEHFNFPWKAAIEEKRFERNGLDIQWRDIPQGTGRMCEMLRTGETDIAVILTEGIVRDIALGNPSCIVQVYVESPLFWGIHVAAGSPHRDLSALKNKTVAISRYGSGSHLMAVVHASSMGWNPEDLGFEVVDTVAGAVDALESGRADYFMWERFMTKPLVDEGTFRKLGDFPTPWPCFVIAARREFVEQNGPSVTKMLETLNGLTSKIKDDSTLPESISNYFGLQQDDVQTWLATTEWSSKPPAKQMLNNVQKHLLDLSLIHKKATFTQLTCVAARCYNGES